MNTADTHTGTCGTCTYTLSQLRSGSWWCDMHAPNGQTYGARADSAAAARGAAHDKYLSDK